MFHCLLTLSQLVNLLRNRLFHISFLAEAQQVVACFWYQQDVRQFHVLNAALMVGRPFKEQHAVRRKYLRLHPDQQLTRDEILHLTTYRIIGFRCANLNPFC